MKTKKLDPAIEMDTSLVSEKVKDTPIVLPDGVPVKLGMTIYSVDNAEVYSSSKECPSYSGKARSKILKNTVIGVNQAANARTFTVRTDRGCENTYSVRNNCLPQIFGKKISAIYEAKRVAQQDIDRIEEKARISRANLEKYKSTVAKIRAAKY